MNTKELVLTVAKQTKLPRDQVDAISRQVFQKFAELIETQGSFESPWLQVIGSVAPAQPAAEGRPAKDERKFARLRLPPNSPRS
jgi:hypothetical protein